MVPGYPTTDPRFLFQDVYYFDTYYRRFRRIDKESLPKIFSDNTTQEGPKVVRQKILCDLCTWIPQKDLGSIAITDFDEDTLEAQCEALSARRGMGSKQEYNKGHNKPPIWDWGIYKLGIVLNKLYAWLRLENNSKGVSLTWLAILKDTSPHLGGKPIEGP